jgi:hypothetical protein
VVEIKARQIITDDKPTRYVDLGREFCAVTRQETKAFVAEHHRHNAAPRAWKFGQGLLSSGELVAVVIAGRQ